MPAQEIDVGTVLGDTYEITQMIGQGGMGAVWAARHKRLPKRFAVKVLLGQLQDSEGFARFKREAEIASRIGHPNIVEVLDFNTLPSGTPYLVMEFLEGESLAKRIKVRGALALEEVLGLARQIGSALNAAHKADVVHRDLKPDNIFLCPSDSGGVVGDRVKILDFGISKIRNAATVLTQESTLMGTPQYMSPEQASGKNSLVDQRTDVFALGAIVYEMLTGKPAFFGETLATVVVKVMLEPPPPIEELAPSIPKGVRDAVYRALEKDPTKRFADVGAFIGALTGTPLQTLDRRPVVNPAEVGFAKTEAPGTPVPPTNNKANPPDPYAATGVGTPVPGSLARGEVSIPTEPVRRKSNAMLLGAIGGVIALGVGLAFVGLKMKTPDPAAEAQGLFEKGRNAFNAKDYEGALRYFDEAQAKRFSPILYYNIGLTQERLGHSADAVQLYRKYLSESSEVRNRDEVEGRLARLDPPKAPEKAPPPPEKAPPPVEEPAKAPEGLASIKANPKNDHGGDVLKKDLPPEVVAELNDADKALEGGDPREAIRLARHSLLAKKSGRAFSIIVRANCKQGDLGGAKAAMHSVEGHDIARVKRECKAAGIDL